MPWLPMYASEDDLKWVFSILSNEEEIAFVTASGPGRWIAIDRLDYSGDMRYCIWHIPSGPLPLLRPQGQADGCVKNPWQGWKEEQQGADSTVPYFGPGHPGVIWLNAKAKSKRRDNTLGLSSFEWVGNAYRLIGRPAPEHTERFWKRLGRTIKKEALRIPRMGAWNGQGPEIWALPDALSRIQQGIERDGNP